MILAELQTKTAVKQEDIIGTKWISLNKHMGGNLAVEFIDRKNCLYISHPRQYSMTYSVQGGNIYFSCINGPFILKGDVLFNNDLPVFKKAA